MDSLARFGDKCAVGRVRSNISYILFGLAAAALIFVAGLVVYRGLESQRADEIQTAKSANAAREHAGKQVERYCVPLPPDAENDCRREVEDSYRDYYKESRDLEAQRETATWTALMGAAALIGMAVSIIGVGLVFITFRATLEGNEIAREAMMAENRAWIEILPNFTLGDLRYEGEEFRLDTKFSVKNIGKTVALHVGFNIDLIPDPQMFPHSKAVEAFKERLISHSKNIDTWPVFPNRELEKQWDIGRAADEMALENEGPGADFFMPALCIGVRYNTIFDREGDPPHVTIEVASIRRVENGLPTYSIHGRNNLPANRLALLRSMINLTDVT